MMIAKSEWQELVSLWDIMNTFYAAGGLPSTMMRQAVEGEGGVHNVGAERAGHGKAGWKTLRTHAIGYK